MKKVIASTKQIVITQTDGPIAQMVFGTKEANIVPVTQDGQTTFGAAYSVGTTILHFDREAAESLISELQEFLAEISETPLKN
jgi:hypothetical protein